MYPQYICILYIYMYVCLYIFIYIYFRGTLVTTKVGYECIYFQYHVVCMQDIFQP